MNSLQGEYSNWQYADAKGMLDHTSRPSACRPICSSLGACLPDPLAVKYIFVEIIDFILF